MIGLYIHVPFCIEKCPYCNFYSFRANKKQKAVYFSAILAEIRKRGGKKRANTLYFGGGTPTLLESDKINKIIKYATCYFGLGCDDEITIEANPKTLSKKKLFELKKAGVNRLSIGAQSGSIAELKALGRKHNLRDVENAVRIAKSEGFENISVDIIIGAPGQTVETMLETLEFVEKLDIDHCSLYQLKIEPETPFGQNPPSNLASEDDVATIYLAAIERLKKMGFKQYEISNFSKKFKQSKHNLKYWTREEYIGFGPGAHSFLDGKRFFHEPNFGKYISDVMYVRHEEVLNPNFEWLMLGLRLSRGVGLLDLKRKGFWDKVFEAKTKKLQDVGYVKLCGGRFCLTPRGMLVQNAILLNLCDNIH